MLQTPFLFYLVRKRIFRLNWIHYGELALCRICYMFCVYDAGIRRKATVKMALSLPWSLIVDAPQFTSPLQKKILLRLNRYASYTQGDFLYEFASLLLCLHLGV